MRIRLVLVIVAALTLWVASAESQSKSTKPAQKTKAPQKAATSSIPELVLQGKVSDAVKLATKSPASAITAMTSLMASADGQIVMRKIAEAQTTLDATQKFLEACDKAGGIKDLPRDALKGRQFRLQGIQLSDQQDYAKAEAFLRQALQVSKNIKDTALEAGVHNNLGYALEKMDLLEEAAREYDTARQMAEEQKDDMRAASSNFNLGVTLYKLKRLDPALAAFKRAAEKSKVVSRTDIEAMAIRQQAQVMGAKDQRSQEAIKLFQEAETMFEKLGDNLNAGITCYLMGDLLAYNLNFRKAAECGEKAAAFYVKTDYKPGLQRCYEFLGDMYGRLGEIPTAEKYKKLAKDLESKK